MKLYPSNAGACGVRIICEFPRPNRELPAIEKSGYTDNINQTYTPEAYVDISPIAPRETAVERFHRLVADVQEKQEAGVIQAFLASGADDAFDVDYDGCGDCNCSANCHALYMWREILRSAGFKETPFYNSNSGNNCGIFTLVYDNRPEDER